MWKYKDVIMVPCILFPPLGTVLAAVCELVVARHTLDITMKYIINIFFSIGWTRRTE